MVLLACTACQRRSASKMAEPVDRKMRYVMLSSLPSFPPSLNPILSLTPLGRRLFFQMPFKNLERSNSRKTIKTLANSLSKTQCNTRNREGKGYQVFGALSVCVVVGSRRRQFRYLMLPALVFLLPQRMMTPWLGPASSPRA